MVEKGGIAARIAESKRCAHRSSRYRLCTFEVSRPGKTVGKSRGCAPKDCGGVAVRDMARSRGSISRAVWLWGQTAVGLSPPGNHDDFSTFGSCVENYGEFDRSKNFSEYLNSWKFYFSTDRFLRVIERIYTKSFGY